MKLKEMRPGDRAIVSEYLETESVYSQKLKELGVSPGCLIELVSVAPGGDPMLLKIRDFRISLRKNEADLLELTRVES